jgi:hypothetical protein
MRKRRPDGIVLSIGDHTFVWAIQREPRWSTADRWKGLAVLVQLESGSGRNLLLVLPFEKKTQRADMNRQRPDFTVAELEENIRRAMNSGWNPHSRGKTFVFQVGAANVRWSGRAW